MTATPAAGLLSALDQMGQPRILVLGDLILDRYTWGNAERISQEAPVVVLRTDKREHRLGGAANVCQMVRGLNAEVTCVGVIGNDGAGRAARRICRRSGIDARHVHAAPDRPTTVKERFIGRACYRHPNQILRVDREVRDPISQEVEDQLIQGIEQSLSDHQILLISDYGKGVCTARVLRGAIDAARRVGVPVLVDPLRGHDYRRYQGATLMKPNRVETSLATGIAIAGPEDAIRAGQQLCRMLDLELAVVTLDSDGMALVHSDGRGELFPTQARAVYDITGAGDMVLAMLGVCLASGLTPEQAVHLGNVAGGLEVERTGVTIVTRDEIRSHLQGGRRPAGGKIVSIEQAQRIVHERQSQGRRVVFTNGCFDLLHVGHVTYLAEAAALGDLLVVAINSDDSVRALKGPSRPIIPEQDRAAMLAALGCVDHVIIFGDATPHRLLHALRPDVLVKGGTYAPHEVVGHEVVQQYGGEVRVTGVVDGISTTRILAALTGDGEVPRAPVSPVPADAAAPSIAPAAPNSPSVCTVPLSTATAAATAGPAESQTRPFWWRAA